MTATGKFTQRGATVLVVVDVTAHPRSPAGKCRDKRGNDENGCELPAAAPGRTQGNVLSQDPQGVRTPQDLVLRIESNRTSTREPIVTTAVRADDDESG